MEKKQCEAEVGGEEKTLSSLTSRKYIQRNEGNHFLCFFRAVEVLIYSLVRVVATYITASMGEKGSNDDFFAVAFLKKVFWKKVTNDTPAVNRTAQKRPQSKKNHDLARSRKTVVKVFCNQEPADRYKLFRSNRPCDRGYNQQQLIKVSLAKYIPFAFKKIVMSNCRWLNMRKCTRSLISKNTCLLMSVSTLTRACLVNLSGFSIFFFFCGRSAKN